ncbi:hypothetical protein FKM82_007567 [Ascaphus truei]
MMRSMSWLGNLVLFSALLTLSRSLDPGVFLQLDGCALQNVVTDILTNDDIIKIPKTLPSPKKEKGKKSQFMGLSQIHVDNFQFTKISLELLPGTGIQMSVTSNVAISGKSFLGGKTELKMEINILTATSLQNENSSCPKFVMDDCKTSLIDVKANLPSGILPNAMNNFLDKTLKTLLPGMLCPPVDQVLSTVNAKLCMKDDSFPLGKSGSLQYTVSQLPTVTKTHMDIELNITVQHGESVIYPSWNSTDSISVPSNPKATSLVLTADFLGCAFTALQEDGEFNFLGTEHELAEVGVMSLSVLSELLPELPPGLQDCKINISVNEPAMVTLDPNKALLHLYSSMEVTASSPDSDAAPEALFVVNVHMNFRIQFSVDGKNLHTVLSLDRTFLSLTSSSVGFFEVLDLNEFITSVVRDAYTPAINGMVETAISLPDMITMLNINFAKAHIQPEKDLLLISVNVCRA